MSKPKILFIGGSINQTTMMHKISKELPECDAYFTPYFASGPLWLMTKLKMLEFTIMGGQFKRKTLEYIRNNNLKLDFEGRNDDYDLVFTSQDLIVPRNIKKFKTILVQEGMTDPPDWRYHVTRFLGLGRWCASTSMTGLSHMYDYFCIASEGFREQFIDRGVNPQKIRVTGIPNFDDFERLKNLEFEHKNFVLVATSDVRETTKYENRKQFLLNAKKIAGDKQIIVKLHPNEIISKRTAEVKKYLPEALVYHGVSIDPMLANCDALVTRFSSTIFPAIALGKDVYCNIDLEDIKRLFPIQNNGTSAGAIAQVARELLASTKPVVRVKEKNKYMEDLKLEIKYLFRQKLVRAK
ncbi:MAG: hypothetical protein IT276_10750 [Ignavibacteriaceae bacterium]|nr:hypothetical protein [Ignavibacterium sp.]MCC6255384.1 hypothetical protein [Ignavibacteriaceae bacterium]HRN25142.1 hypothetical protein [Ignavibacteriaceae bacterium]HRP93642.1 hypothetical protein [Ignavibacteriaceae bacterium]HRQ54114.1 hypothetical protein [Ignavibacteriaceae bacterium]